MGVVRGGMAPQARPRGASRRSAGRARRAAHRAPLRPSPRRALARTPCGARGCGLGRRAPARPRLHHRRPRLAPLRDAGARGAASRDRPLLRRPRQPRLRRQPRSVLPARRSEGDRRSRERHAPRRRRRRGRAARAARSDRRRRPAGVRGSKRSSGHARGSTRRTCGSSSATSRESSSASRASSTSCSPGTCTPARSSCRIPGGGCGSRTSALATSRASTTTAPTQLHVSPGLGTTFVPFRLFARPEVTELVVRSA